MAGMVPGPNGRDGGNKIWWGGIDKGRGKGMVRGPGFPGRPGILEALGFRAEVVGVRGLVMLGMRIDNRTVMKNSYAVGPA